MRKSSCRTSTNASSCVTPQHKSLHALLMQLPVSQEHSEVAAQHVCCATGPEKKHKSTCPESMLN